MERRTNQKKGALAASLANAPFFNSAGYLVFLSHRYNVPQIFQSLAIRFASLGVAGV
jgi:hypothetical protein